MGDCAFLKDKQDTFEIHPVIPLLLLERNRNTINTRNESMKEMPETAQ